MGLLLNLLFLDTGIHGVEGHRDPGCAREHPRFGLSTL